MKIFAAIAAGVILVALAFLHPAPAPIAAVAPVQQRASQPAAHARAPIAPLVVYVAGQVRNPGLYRVPAGSRVGDALRKAGGFATQADRAGVNLAEIVQDGEEIRVPRIGEGTPPAGRKAARKKRSRARSSQGPRVSVDLNSAGADELAQLPGVGQTLAARIVAYRAQNGPFASADELADVSGMTQRRIDAIAQYLIVR